MGALAKIRRSIVVYLWVSASSESIFKKIII